ncbi:Deoxyuridine 5'-triphosphate nucleotidohydrolase [Nymphaea thermarum]|nr:Deoxyuridine 5'-triphosphate nucleotidohydrolase [Nymphaea thermarum]
MLLLPTTFGKAAIPFVPTIRCPSSPHFVLLGCRSTMVANGEERNAAVAPGDAEGEQPATKIQKVVQSYGDSHRALFLRVKKLSPNAVLPSRGSPLAAGYDLSSAVEAFSPLPPTPTSFLSLSLLRFCFRASSAVATIVPARGKALVATDLSIAIPEGTYARIAPRSGLAWKHSIDVGAGVIDADYRGPVGVILFNHSDSDFQVNAGDRIAQLVLEKIVTPDVCEVEDLDSTARGTGGFGSTGV